METSRSARMPTFPDTISRKCGKVRNGHAAEAWESTTAEFKSALGREAFQRSVASSVLLKQPLEFASTQTVSVQDQSRAEYLFHNPTLKGPTARIVIGREAGTWKVDRLVAD